MCLVYWLTNSSVRGQNWEDLLLLLDFLQSVLRFVQRVSESDCVYCNANTSKWRLRLDQTQAANKCITGIDCWFSYFFFTFSQVYTLTRFRQTTRKQRLSSNDYICSWPCPYKYFVSPISKSAKSTISTLHMLLHIVCRYANRPPYSKLLAESESNSL